MMTNKKKCATMHFDFACVRVCVCVCVPPSSPPKKSLQPHSILTESRHASRHASRHVFPLFSKGTQT